MICPSCGGPKFDGYILCQSCWNRVPTKLRDAWDAADTLSERRIACSDILRWARDNGSKPIPGGAPCTP